ncbi:unnamed protein product [Prunus armeniaca]
MIGLGGYLQFPTPTAFLSLFYYFPPLFLFSRTGHKLLPFPFLFSLQTQNFSATIFFLRSLLPFHEARPRKKVQSGRNHPSPAAGKKTQVEPSPVVPSSFQRSPFVAAGKMLPFVLAAKYPKPLFYPSCFHCTNSAHGVGASKEGPVPLSRFLPSLILLELLERYTHLGHR